MSKTLNINKLSSEVDKLKMTKLQVAEKCGISRVTLDSVLKGKEIGLHKFLKIIDVIGVNVGYFFDEEINIENKEFNSIGDHAIQADKISKIDARDQRVTTTSTAGKPSYEALEQKVTALQEELLEARAEIINLMKQTK